MTSWWTDPKCQQDRETFHATQRAQEPRWTAEANRIGQVMSGIGMGDWSIRAPKRTSGYQLVVP